MKVCSRCQLEYRDDTRMNCLVDGTPLTSVQDPRLGRTVMGRYAIEKLHDEQRTTIICLARVEHLDDVVVGDRCGIAHLATEALTQRLIA